MKNVGEPKLLVVGRLMMLCGVLLMLAAAAFWFGEWKVSKGQTYAVATVTELGERVSRDGSVEYFPRFRFQTASGQFVQSSLPEAEKEAKYAVGDTVRVAYAPATPTEMRVATVASTYAGAIGCGVLGVIFFDGGAVVWWLGRRRLLRVKPAGPDDRNRKLFAGLFGQNGGYRP